MGRGDRGIQLRTVSRSEAKEQVLSYIREHPGALTSQIIESLELDPSLVGEVLEALESAGDVEGRPVVRSTRR